MWSRRVLWGIGLGVPTVLAYGAWAQPPPPPPAVSRPAPTAAPTAAPSAAPSAATSADDPPPLPPPAPRRNVPLVPPPDPAGTTAPRPAPQQRRPRYPYGYGYGYGYPYGYGYGRRYQVPYRPPRKLPYRPGEPPPDGYELDTRMRKGFIIAGAVTFGATYLLSAAVAAAFQQDNEGDGFTPLFVPIVGPFITTGTVDASAFGTFALILDGIAQTYGLGMLIFGAADREKIWIRKETAFDVHPIFVDGEPAGAGVRGDF